MIQLPGWMKNLRPLTISQDSCGGNQAMPLVILSILSIGFTILGILCYRNRNLQQNA